MTSDINCGIGYIFILMLCISDAQARLNGRRMHCRSTQTAEHIASIFAIGTLFILCNPDKVRARQDASQVGHQCQVCMSTTSVIFRYLTFRNGRWRWHAVMVDLCHRTDFWPIGKRAQEDLSMWHRQFWSCAEDSAIVLLAVLVSILFYCNLKTAFMRRLFMLKLHRGFWLFMQFA